MELYVIVDNNTLIGNDFLCGEPGLSYYIEDEGKKIIFDTGLSDLYLKNVKVLGLDLSKADTLVFSHGHNDHTNGLKYMINTMSMKNKKIIAHPNSFLPKYSLQGEYNGSSLLVDDITKICDLELTDKPVDVSPNIVFLGKIPHAFEFEKEKVIGRFVEDDINRPDYMVDDSALAYKSKDGIFVITGCSHSGICNIIEYAKEVCGNNNVIGVVGGFHLFKYDEKAMKTIEYLKNNNIDKLYPCHCVSLEVKCKMMNELNVNEVGVGTKIYID